MSSESVLGLDPRISARALASRSNGARSRGPKTAAGKARSARNALKRGLCAQKLLVLPDEDAAAFKALEATLVAELAPQGALEAVLAQRVVSGAWRLARADRMEAELLASRRGRDGDLGLALVRDGNGTKSLETLLRYRGAALAEFMRALRTLQALQAEARAGAGLSAAPPARRRRLLAQRNEPEQARRINALPPKPAAEPRHDAPGSESPRRRPGDDDRPERETNPGHHGRSTPLLRGRHVRSHPYAPRRDLLAPRPGGAHFTARHDETNPRKHSEPTHWLEGAPPISGLTLASRSFPQGGRQPVIACSPCKT
jgi:hypothetical protein